MSDMIENVNYDEMTIQQLRQYCSHARVALSKTATKEEIIKALDAKRRDRVIAQIADENTQLKPGYARLKIHADPMPGASNTPVFLACNGYQCLIPRDVEVVVPMRVVRTLNDSYVMRKRQTFVQDQYGREITKDTVTKTYSYPFQVLETNPGPELLTSYEISKRRTMGPRVRYRDLFGHWPRRAEMNRAIEQGLIKLEVADTMTRADELAKEAETE